MIKFIEEMLSRGRPVKIKLPAARKPRRAAGGNPIASRIASLYLGPWGLEYLGGQGGGQQGPSGLEPANPASIAKRGLISVSRASSLIGYRSPPPGEGGEPGRYAAPGKPSPPPNAQAHIKAAKSGSQQPPASSAGRILSLFAERLKRKQGVKQVDVGGRTYKAVVYTSDELEKQGVTPEELSKVAAEKGYAVIVDDKVYYDGKLVGTLPKPAPQGAKKPSSPQASRAAQAAKAAAGASKPRPSASPSPAPRTARPAAISRRMRTARMLR